MAPPVDAVRVGLLVRAVRFRYVSVTAAFLLFALASAKDDGDLEYFSDALTILGRAGGHGNIHLYQAAPDIQIGPLAIVGVGLLDLLCAGKLIFAVTAGALALLLILLRCLERLALDAGRAETPVGVAVAVGGVVLAAAWVVVVPGWGHLDDLAALTALVAALRAVRSGRAGWAGGLLAVAVGCKPWGAFAVGMLLFLPADRRLRAAAVFGLATAVCWGPFVLGAPSTLGALAHFALPTSAGTLPALLGYEYAPGWVRPAQLLLSCASVALCWRRGRFDLVLLCVGISRLSLDAGLFPYYDAELVLGCLAADILAVGPASSTGRSVPARVSACAPLTIGCWTAVSLIRSAHLASADTFAARVSLYAVLLALAAARRGRAPAPVTAPRAVAGPVRTSA